MDINKLLGTNSSTLNINPDAPTKIKSRKQHHLQMWKIMHPKTTKLLLQHKQQIKQVLHPNQFVPESNQQLKSIHNHLKVQPHKQIHKTQPKSVPKHQKIQQNKQVPNKKVVLKQKQAPKHKVVPNVVPASLLHKSVKANASNVNKNKKASNQSNKDKQNKHYPPFTITAILPAHNEASGIIPAIKSIRSHVNNIIVACDNCNDDTAKEAKRAGADIVFNTVNNKARKAGALNQALKYKVNWSIPNQYLLIMDADTQVVNPDLWFKKAEGLIYPQRPVLSKKAREIMAKHKMGRFKFFHPRKYHKLFDGKAFDCVGSIFKAPKHLKHNSNIEEGQRLEWEAYMSKIRRDRKVFVLTGTCSLISAKKMLEVHHNIYHGKFFYNPKNITEDFRMTIDLKECNARMISPVDCQCITATKYHIKDLLSQRRRWYLGALQIVGDHKDDKVMRPYLRQQIMLFISVFAFLLFLGVSIYLYLVGSVELTILWTVVFIGFDIDQVARVWGDSNIIDKIYSISIIGCLYYSLLLQLAYIWAFETWIDRKKVYWNSKDKAKNSNKSSLKRGDVDNAINA